VVAACRLGSFPFSDERLTVMDHGSTGATLTRRYRLVTRSDFDGLVCAVLLRELDVLDDTLFVHPKDMQDGKVEITEHDITTNLPYVPGAHLAFDHHHSESERVGDAPSNLVCDANADSAARVLYDYFGGAERFGHVVSDDLMAAVDKADRARFDMDEILHPTGWVLLNYLMDPRTGLGRFRDFTVSNYQLMMMLIEAVLALDVDQVIALPDVRERVELFEAHRAQAEKQIRRCSTVHENLVVLDLRDEDVIYAANRFLIYALYPGCNVSIHELWGRERQNVVFATGASIVNRTSTTDIGTLMLRYGGGGHEAAGTCQIATEDAPRVLDELISELTRCG
jgi:nanoRNase/pAp phosphatase (c-di-AMP/oligoRNAs hydrolase)